MHDTILKSKVFLDHIAIESTNPKKIAEFYSKNLMMKKNCVSNSEWHCFGPNRLLIFKKGIKNKLSFAAFGIKTSADFANSESIKRVYKSPNLDDENL